MLPQPEKTISFQITYSLKDIIDANLSFRKSKPAYKTQLFTVFVLGAISIGYATLPLVLSWLSDILLPTTPGRFETWHYIWTPLLFIIVFSLLFLIVWFDLFRQLLIYWSYKRDKTSYSTPSEFTFDTHGCTICRKFIKLELEWPYYQAALIGKKQLILLKDNKPELVIPKRIFENDIELQNFIELIKKHLELRFVKD